MSVFAAGCRVGVEHDGAPGVGVYGQGLRGRPGNRGSAAASVDYRVSSGFEFDRAHGDVGLRSESCVRPVEVGAVIVHVHRDREHLTFADDLGRDRSDEREVGH